MKVRRSAGFLAALAAVLFVAPPSGRAAGSGPAASTLSSASGSATRAPRVGASTAGSPFGLVPGDADPASFRLPAPPGVASDRRVAALGAVELFKKADDRGRDSSGRDWYAGYNNENGSLAWGESFVMDSYLTMYDATGDKAYLDRFWTHARSLIAQTDEVRQVTDYAGRSGPVWRAGSRYGYASLLVPGRDGSPIGYLIAKKNQLNSFTYAVIRAGSAPGTFKMMFLNEKFAVAEGYDKLVSDRRSANYWVRRINARSVLVRAASLRAASDRTLAKLAERLEFESIYMVHGVHTGLLAYPLARFARTVRADATLAAAYSAEATEALSVAERGIAFHDAEWVDESETGYYRFLPGAPIWCDGVGLPYNQNVAVGSALVELWRATGNETYRAKAEKIARHFKAGLSSTYVAGYAWRYWWGPGLTGWDKAHSPSLNTPIYAGFSSWEDIVHGTYDIDFVVDAARAGIVFTDTDLAKFANTMVLTMQMPGEADFYNRVNGQNVGSMSRNGVRAARWLALARVSRDLYSATNPYVEEDLLQEQPYGMGLLAAALKAAVEASYSAEPTAAALAPTVRLLEPTVTVTRGDVSVVASLGPGAERADVYVDGLRPRTVTVRGPDSWLVSTTSLSDGRRTFQVVVQDAVGRARVASRRVTIDNTPPKPFWWIAPPALTPNGDDDRDVGNWFFGASEAGQRQVVVLDSNGTLVATPMPWTFTSSRDTGVTFDGRGNGGGMLPDGRYTLRVFASDALGNVRTFPPKPLIISRVARWQTKASRTMVFAAKGGTVKLRLSRWAIVSASLVKGTKRIAVVRSPRPAGAGWVSLKVARTLVTKRRVRVGGAYRTVTSTASIPRGRYVLSVSVKYALGTVPLTRTLALR